MPPTILIQSLQGVRRRAKLLGLAYGLGIVIACAAALLVASVGVDYLFNLPAVARLLVIASAAGAIALAMVRWVIQPTLARLSLSDVAGRLEQTFPQFNDRLRSTLDFLNVDAPGSPTMKQQVVNEATTMASQINLSRAVVARPAIYSAGGAVGALLILAGLAMLIGPQYTHIALSRLFDPFGAPNWPKRILIEMVGSVPTRVPVGQRIDVRMRLARGDRESMKAIVYYRQGNGPIQQEYMTRGADGSYSVALDARAADSAEAGQLKVWLKSGDDEKQLDPITVVPRLAITRVITRITPPAYAQTTPTLLNLGQGPALMTAGSTVELTIEFNKPIDPASTVQLQSLTPSADPADIAKIQWNRSNPANAIATFNASQSLRFHLIATDTDGFRNSGLEEYELIVHPDQNPTVQIENPRRNEERTPESVVPLMAVADDDFGIRTATLIVDRLGDKKHWEIPLVADGSPISGVQWNRLDGSAERRRFGLGYQWELNQLADAKLKSGDVLEYYIQVQDNYIIGTSVHPPVLSGKLRITLISQEELANRVTDELRTMAGQINEIRNTQTRTKEETENLARETKDRPELNTADRAAAERLANQQSTTASQTRQVAGKMDAILQRLRENRSKSTELQQLSTDVRDQLNQTAENPMKEAANNLNNARQPNKPAEERNNQLAQAQHNQQQSADQLQKALDRMGNIGSLQQTMDKIKDLLAEQQHLSRETAEIGRRNLGKTPDQMNPEDRAKLDKLSKEQEALARRTEKAIADMQKLADQLAKSDPATSDAMKQSAQTGQQQQVSANQSRAAQQTAQNQQAQAQASQKQAELGLQMMLDHLRQAERRKLEELSRQLAEIQEQLAHLVRRQAGHNLDNIAIQGPDRINQIGTKLIAELSQKAGRDKSQPPAPSTLPQLTSAQEQTTRNTRDIAKSIEDAPNGAEPAAHLTRAAGKMDRAIVALRENNPVAAYDPSQVEALASLEEAQRIVDEQKAAVDQKLEQQQKEAVRQAYEKIKQEQEKLNQETTRIDQSPRLDDGSFRREEAVRLAQLPKQQSQLAERINKLEEDLAAVGSVVYIWANKDIATSMNQVKDQLAKSSTGKPTQAEQARIIEQLDAMIRNLAIEPQQSKFANRNSGGGGGGSGQGNGAPSLPPEVELRLLKELQLAINRNTKAIDALPEKDKSQLLELGNRQGELRNLLDQLLQKSSKGQVKLGPEPDNKDQLPEEAGKEEIENQELENSLLTDEPTAEQIEKDVNRIGDRMARSRQRLALNNDPGKTTQIIQDRIIANLDELIQMARNQQTNSSSSSNPQVAEQQPKPQPGDPSNQQPGQSQPNHAQTPAQSSTVSPGQSANPDPTTDIHQNMAEWGGLTPRQRQAVIEGSNETIIQKYKGLVDDYYRSLATKATER
ncbi:MAG: hypothetical protein IT447_03650 [Phycisphaerales bacterium]|jgi:hypothetical protein|nr:hypothetical protein [Phycisphaerales bacterium]